MRSSSTDPGQAATSSFLPTSRSGWLRLVLVVLLGVAALLAPQVVAKTGAFYTDRSTVSGDLTTAPTFSPVPSPSPA